jgi:hypothetical protein
LAAALSTEPAAERRHPGAQDADVVRGAVVGPVVLAMIATSVGDATVWRR